MRGEIFTQCGDCHHLPTHYTQRCQKYNIKSKLEFRLLDKLGSSDLILFHFLLPGVYEHKSTKVRVTVVNIQIY